MKYSIVDTHCHLDIVKDQGLEIEDSLTNAARSGVKKIIQIGIDYENSKQAISIAKDFSEKMEIFFTIGCHPCHGVQSAEEDLIADLIENYYNDPKFVGIGEIGLDYYHSKDDWEDQKRIFRRFIEVSIEKRAPIIVHSRDAAQDTLEILKDYKDQAFGVIHCFTYDEAMAQEFCKLGYYISFSGIVTFKNAKDIQMAARNIPLQNILIETDAPFLAPMPHRGKRNEPAYVSHVLEHIFTLRSEDQSEIEKILFENSMKFIQKKAATC
jgi:TatD DNase family protein